MDKKILFAEVKVYVYLYLITAPFTYLVYEAGNFGDNPLATNIFIALSLWIYIKKIQPIMKEKGISGINILLLLLVTAAVLFSVKSVALIENIESEISSLEYTVSSMQYDISDIKDEVENR